MLSIIFRYLIALAFLRSSPRNLTLLFTSLSFSLACSLSLRACVCLCFCLWSPGGKNKPKQGKIRKLKKKTLQKLHHFHVQTMCKGFGAADSRISSSRIALFVCVCFLFRFFFSMLLLTVNESRFACCLLGFRGKPATWIGCLSFQNNTNCFCFTWFSQSANKPKSVACFPTTGLQNSTSTFRIALCSLTQRYLKSWRRSVVVAFALHIVCDFKKRFSSDFS